MMILVLEYQDMDPGKNDVSHNSNKSLSNRYPGPEKDEERVMSQVNTHVKSCEVKSKPDYQS